MKNDATNTWKPDPQLLAAYFDGEMEGRDELADLRAHVEAWLESHPEGLAEWTAHKQLQQLWSATTPAEPSPAAWDKAHERATRRKHMVATPRWSWLKAGAMAASIAVAFGVLFGTLRWLQSPERTGEAIAFRPKFQTLPPATGLDEVLPVAVAAEITILRVDGTDIDALAVGTLPVIGALELADPGDVLVFERPDSPDQMLTVRQNGPHRPVIWARINTE